MPDPETTAGDETPTKPAPLDDAVGGLRGAVQTVVNATQLDGYDDKSLLLILRWLRESTAKLHQVDATIVRHLYLTAEHGRQQVDGIGEVWIGRSRAQEKWEPEAVAQAVIDHHLEELGGELPNDLMDVARWLLEVIAGDRCRVTPLRAMGYDPDAFRESVPGKPKVDLPSPRLT